LAQEIADSGLGSITVIDGVDINTAEAECKKINDENQFVAISCYNSPNQFAISGNQEAMIQAEDRFIELGGQISPILTAPPIHCLLMQSVAQQLEMELKKYSFNNFKWPIISNVDALPYLDSSSIIGKLKLQLTHPVQWLATINYLENQGVTTLIEIGPQSVLTNLIKTYLKNVTIVSFSKKVKFTPGNLGSIQ
jgi:[acyl-carrier-protein] S-malonyltransferase